MEKAFGILSSRWRIFQRDINLMPDTTDTLIVVTCILHNMLSHPGEAEHCLREASEDVFLRGLNERPNRASLEACKNNLITDYFNSQAGMLVPFFLYLCGICHRELNAFELPQSVSRRPCLMINIHDSQNFHPMRSLCRRVF